MLFTAPLQQAIRVLTWEAFDARINGKYCSSFQSPNDSDLSKNWRNYLQRMTHNFDILNSMVDLKIKMHKTKVI